MTDLTDELTTILVFSCLQQVMKLSSQLNSPLVMVSAYY